MPRDGSVWVDEAAHLHHIDGPLSNKASQCDDLSGEPGNKLRLKKRVGLRPQAVKRKLDDIKSCCFKPLGCVTTLAGQNYGRMHAASTEWGRQPKSLILRASKEWVVNHVEDVHSNGP
jgi:hypothetical protein